MGNIISTVIADQRKPLDSLVREQVRQVATEVAALLNQASGMEQNLVQLHAALSINSAMGGKQAVDQAEQQIRLLNQGLDKAYLLIADKLNFKV
jgi:hypothetical protein